MEIRITRGHALPVRVALAGEFDLATAPDLRASLDNLDGDIDVDCSDITFMDAACLGVFATLHTRCEEEGAKLVFIDVPPFALRLFEITGLDTHFNLRIEPGAQ